MRKLASIRTRSPSNSRACAVLKSSQAAFRANQSWVALSASAIPGRTSESTK